MPRQPTTERYTCQITTVDPTNTAGQVGFVIKGDAQERRAIVITPPVAFRWPQVGETWTVRKENDTWYLDGLLAPSTLSRIAPGDMTLNAPTGIVHVIGSINGVSDYLLPRSGLGFLAQNGAGTAGQSWIPAQGWVAVPNSYGTITVKNPNGATVIGVFGMTGYAGSTSTTATLGVQLDGHNIAGSGSGIFFFNQANVHAFMSLAVFSVFATTGSHTLNGIAQCDTGTLLRDQYDNHSLIAMELS